MLDQLPPLMSEVEAFFIKMKVLKKKEAKSDPTQPLNEGEDIDKSEEVQEAKPDLNCADCEGSGLIWHEGGKKHERCIACQGTGKFNQELVQFPIGTKVYKSDGVYLQTQEGLVKQ